VTGAVVRAPIDLIATDKRRRKMVVLMMGFPYASRRGRVNLNRDGLQFTLNAARWFRKFRVWGTLIDASSESSVLENHFRDFPLKNANFCAALQKHF
jgi:hypothetical protein